MVFVAGELDMQGGTITGNYNTVSNIYGVHGGGVEVNKYDDGNGAAKFTMSGGVIKGNRTGRDGGGVNVCKGGTFIMQSGAEVSGNTADREGGGVGVHTNEYAITTFTLEGGTIYGAGADANTASAGASLQVSAGTAKWGSSSTSISGGSGTKTAGGNILSGNGTGSTNDTLSATGS
jgi:hypothetical protein